MIAWAAFLLALLELLFLVGLALAAGRFWRKVEPSVSPLLSLIGPYTSSTAATSSSSVEPAELSPQPPPPAP